MPGISISSAPAIFAAVSRPASIGTSGIGAVNDNRRRLDPFERRATIAVHQRGGHLPGKARRIIRNATSVFERNQMKIIAEPRKSLVLAL